MRFEQIWITASTVGGLRVVALSARKAAFGVAALLSAALAWGCTGVVSGQNSPSQTYTISGTISPATGGSGPTVTLSGAASATTTVNGSGSYAFTGLSNGTYAVTPSQAGYTFSPTSQAATLSGANVAGLNFTDTAQQTHSVSLSWVASSTAGVTGYNVYRSSTSGSGYTKIGSTLGKVFSYTDSTVQGGMYFYVTTAVDGSGNESTFSNEASANVP